MNIGKIMIQELSFAIVGAASSRDYRGWKPLPQTLYCPDNIIEQIGIPMDIGKIPKQELSPRLCLGQLYLLGKQEIRRVLLTYPPVFLRGIDC